MLGIKSGLATYKANTLPGVLSLQPPASRSLLQCWAAVVSEHLLICLGDHPASQTTRKTGEELGGGGFRELNQGGERQDQPFGESNWKI